VKKLIQECKIILLVSGGPVYAPRFCESIVTHRSQSFAHNHNIVDVERDADFLAMFKNRLALGIDYRILGFARLPEFHIPQRIPATLKPLRGP